MNWSLGLSFEVSRMLKLTKLLLCGNLTTIQSPSAFLPIIDKVQLKTLNFKFKFYELRENVIVVFLPATMTSNLHALELPAASEALKLTTFPYDPFV